MKMIQLTLYHFFICDILTLNFYKCGERMKVITDNSGKIVIGYKEDGNTECIIPDGVTRIGRKAFKDCKSLRSITMGNNLEKIEGLAFDDCQNLNSVTFLDGLKTIEEKAFKDCKNLTEVILPNSLSIIENGAFWNCRNLEKLVLPNNLTKIPDNAFTNCRNLLEIILPDSLTAIGEYSFVNCYELKSIKFPDNLMTIGEGAFSCCSNLDDIVLPKGLIEIGKRAFCQCKKITEITIPNNVKTIGAMAFYSCYNLKNITLSDSITSIDKSAFNMCLIKNVNVSSYKVYNLLGGNMKLLATLSILKNHYNNENVQYTEEEMQNLTEYIKSKRFELFHYVSKDENLYKFMMNDAGFGFSYEEAMNIVNNNSKMEVKFMMMQYIHNHNLKKKSILDDWDDEMEKSNPDAYHK